MDDTGYEEIIRDFSGKRLSSALQDTVNTKRKGTLERLMRLSQEELEPEGEDLIDSRRRLLEEEMRIEVAGRKVIMTLEQHKVLSHIDDPTARVMVAQAPTGAIKTYILALYITVLLQKTEGVIVATAPTNLAVQELTQKVLNNIHLHNGD